MWICPYFGARTEQAADGGRARGIRHPQRRRTVLDLEHRDRRQPSAGDSIELAEKLVDITLDAEKQIEFAATDRLPADQHARR